MSNSNRDLNITISFIIIATALAFLASLYLTHGNLTYAIHAPYIHWAMVKHLANEGILSVDGFSYSSVSSSPLWLFLLAPFYALLSKSAFIYVSLLLNVVFQLISIVVIFKIIKLYTDKTLHYLYAILLVLATPFLALSFGGLEHSLQIMLIMLFIYNLVQYFNDDKSKNVKLNMLLLAPFIVAVRYEDIALIIATSIILSIFLKEYKFAFLLIASSLTLVAMFGFWSEGAFSLGFLPTSIGAKSSEGISHVSKFISNISYIHIITLIALNIAILIDTYKKDRNLFYLSSIYLMTFFVHLAFAQVGWLYRYEAYLVTFGLINILLYIYKYAMPKKLFIVLLLILIASNYKQIGFSIIKSILSTRAVYEQQIQEGLLANEFKNYYIATDNIGTIPYFSSDKILDIHGLSDPRIINLKRVGSFNDNSKKALIKSENVDMIIAYKVRFKDDKIDGYKRVAIWKIDNNILNGDDEIEFWARDDRFDEVKEKLLNFAKYKLPKEVEVIWLRD